MPEDLKNIVLELGSNMIKLANKGNNLEENKEKMLETIKNEAADKFEKAKYEIKFFAENETIIKSLNAEKIGRLTCYLGAGRIKKEDKIDMAVGIVLNKKVGDLVKTGDLIATIYSNDLERGEKVKKELQYNFINDNIKQKE